MSLNSCKIPENILQSYSEVDFSTPQKLQISFNEHIYDATIVSTNSKLEINFVNKIDLLEGLCVCLTEKTYKISYNDMVFNGEISELTNSFLPIIIYNFIASFEDGIILDSYDKERKCYLAKRNVNDYFVILECYETEEAIFYSMEIK